MPDLSIREALNQGAKKDEKSNPSSQSTPTSDGQSSSDREAETKELGLKDYDSTLVADVEAELSKMTLDQRKVVEPLFTTVRKKYDKGFHRAMAEVADLKRRLESELKAPIPVKTEVKEAVSESKQTVRGLQRRLDKATDPVEKESIREAIHDLEETIEDTVHRLIQPSLKPLEDRVNRVESTTTSERLGTVNADIDALEDEQGYPAALIEKYRSSLTRAGLEYPNVSMEEILVKLVPWNELKPYVQKREAVKEKKEPRSVTPASVSTKVMPETEVSQFKDKDGHLNIRKMLHGLVGKT